MTLATRVETVVQYGTLNVGELKQLKPTGLNLDGIWNLVKVVRPPLIVPVSYDQSKENLPPLFDHPQPHPPIFSLPPEDALKAGQTVWKLNPAPKGMERYQGLSRAGLFLAVCELGGQLSDHDWRDLM